MVRAPAFAIERAVSYPIPVFAPVTMIVLPVRSCPASTSSAVVFAPNFQLSAITIAPIRNAKHTACKLTAMPDRIDHSEGRRLFGLNPEAYDAARPPYPDALYEFMRGEGAICTGTCTLEIGAG